MLSWVFSLWLAYACKDRFCILQHHIMKKILSVKNLSTIQPRYAIAVTFGIAIIMFVSAFVELRQSKEELLRLLQENSVSLAETVERSSENVVLSTEYIEEQIAERLFNNAYFIARADSAGSITQADLASIARQNNIFRIHIFNAKGRRILSNQIPLGAGLGTNEKGISEKMFFPILLGETDKMVIGFRQARFDDGKRFAVAIKRTQRAGGVIVLTIDAREMAAFRKNIGIGKLIQDLENNSGIEYIVLQDNAGIIAATSAITDMSRIEDDSTLSRAMENDTIVTRQITVNGRQVFEVVRPLSIDQSLVGILRIGVSMDEVRSVEGRMWRRIIIMSLVLIAIGTVLLTAIIANQNYHMMSGKYERAQQFTENILHQMQDIVITFDGQERVTIFNQRAEEFFAVRSSDMIGVHRLQLPAGIQSVLRAASNAGSGIPEQQIVLPNGKEYVLLMSVTTTRKPDGTTESKTVLIKDRTEAKRLEQEIRRKEKLTAMGELASGVAHEIRNPLNAISMIAQRYEKEFSPEKDIDEYRELTGVLKKESARVNKIIQQFLQFARPQNIRKENIDVREFVRHIALLFSPLAESKNVVFTSESDTGVMNIDGEQMTQAFLNILQNALDATPEHGTIQFGVRRMPDGIECRVSDSGIGIPAELREKIFNLYFTTKSNGTGLGLGITHQIVSQHGGTIEVNSEEGKGTTVIVRLPQ